MADNVKHPRVDEFNLSWEQQFAGQFKFTATGIWRDWKNFVNSVLNNGQWAPFAYANALTGQNMTLYKWNNATSVPSFTILNTDTVTYQLAGGAPLVAPEAYRKYRGMMLVFQKAYRNRWQARRRGSSPARRGRSTTAPTPASPAASSRRRTRSS